MQGCDSQGKSLENIFFPGQGKVKEFWYKSGKFRKKKREKVGEKSGNYKFSL